jgi:hypothetical protein
MSNEDTQKVLKNLRANNFDAYFMENSEVARGAILDMIAENAVVGVGDSATVRQIGILRDLEKAGIRILNPFSHNLTTDPNKQEVRYRMSREIFTSDVLITGTNAITVEGKLVNMDAVGNRVAAMIFGPRKVIIAVGRNKIVRDVEEALNRLKNVIAPYHARTKGFGTPCAPTGKCVDCGSDHRICNVTTIIEKRPWRTDMTIFVINEDLGLGWDEEWPTDRIGRIRFNYEKVTWIFASSFQPE